MADVLAWIDTETSGLIAREDSLLEVACILTDTQFNRLVDEPFHAVIRYEPDEVARMHDGADSFVQAMHERTGLWVALSSSNAKPLTQVGEELHAYIRQVAPQPRQARIAGSSIRHDLNFLEQHLPAVYEHLHYRSVDVSALMFVAEHNLGWIDPKIEVPHEALADIEGSIAKLRDIVDHLTGRKSAQASAAHHEPNPYADRDFEPPADYDAAEFGDDVSPDDRMEAERVEDRATRRRPSAALDAEYGQ